MVSVTINAISNRARALRHLANITAIKYGGSESMYLGLGLGLAVAF